MRLEGYDRQELWNSKLSLRGKNQLDWRSRTRHLQYINTFDSWANMSSSWLQTNTRQIHERDEKSWQLEYNVDPCDRGLKIGHSYQIYNVYLCHTDANLSIATTVQMWIHAGNSYNILHRNLGRKLWVLSNIYPGSWSPLPQSTIISMWLQWFEVEHRINHLITGQWWKSLQVQGRSPLM